MPLNFEAIGATLNHINIRKEGPEEQPETAVDLKIKCEAPGTILTDLLGADEQPEFWRNNDERDVLYTGLSEVKTWGVFDRHDLTYAGLHFRSVKLHKFSFKPVAGRQVELEFSVAIHEPTEQQLNTLVEILKEDHTLQIDGPMDLFSEEAA